jgi:dipeptidyl aminopeptidase/acylaminoacyl peptidase
MNELPTLIPRSALFGNPENTGPKISPDSKTLAFLAPLDGVMNVHIRPALARENAHPTDPIVSNPVTSDTNRGISAYYWQQDSQHILYIQDTGGDENWRVYQTDIETRETRDLTPFDNVQARILAIDPRFPDIALLALNTRDPRLHDVYRVDLNTGELILVEKNEENFVQYRPDNQLRIRAAQKMLPDGGTEIYVRDAADSAPWRLLTAWGPDDSGGIVAFSPDDSALYITTSEEANAARLLEIDIESGIPTILAQDEQYDVSGLMINPINREIEAVAFIRARTEWTPLNEEGQRNLDELTQVRDGDLQILSRDDADDLWTVAYVTDDGPVYYYLYNRVSHSAELLFSNRPALGVYQMAKITPIEFVARDGMTLYGYLTLPPQNAAQAITQKWPLVLFVHGGPWARDTWGFSSYVQWLANRGYAVLQINFRGSSGYGKAYLNAGDREWGAKMHTDLLDGKAWAIRQGYADINQVAIMGGSYGGYATLAGLAFTPDEFVCGVDIVGPSNLNTLLDSVPAYWEPIKAQLTKRMGDTEEFLTKRSPLFKAHQINKPLLIAQGANDPRVKIAESDQIVEAMRKANLPVEYLVFPDEGHGFNRPENTLFFVAKAEEFLAKHLGGRAEPFAEVPGSSGEIR